VHLYLKLEGLEQGLEHFKPTRKFLENLLIGLFNYFLGLQLF